MVDGQQNPSDPQVAFEKARFEYVAMLYEKEVKRSEGLETRVQFYFSFVTLILGAIFLNFDVLRNVIAVIERGKAPAAATTTLLMSCAVLGLSLLASVLSMLAFARLHAYRSVYPRNLVTSLFAPNSTYLAEPSEKALYYSTAMDYALALEANTAITDQRARWVRLSSVGIFFTVLSLFAIVGTTAYILIVA